MLQTDVPSVYTDLMKQGVWPKRPALIAVPARRPTP